MPVVDPMQRRQAEDLGALPRPRLAGLRDFAARRPAALRLVRVVALAEADSPLLVSLRRPRPIARALKTGVDVCGATMALVVLAPVLALIAVLVSLDGGPVFFAHRRIGAQGRMFGCLKFRSMVTDSEAVLRAHLEACPQAAEEWALTHKLRHDPRVTAVGRLLRKTSLDELPQLFNVLRRDMSLVGPRPITTLEVCKYADCIEHYYVTRPGITGLWQVSGRNETSYERRVELDTHYATNWSMWLDMTILARTLPAVISGRGAA